MSPDLGGGRKGEELKCAKPDKKYAQLRQSCTAKHKTKNCTFDWKKQTTEMVSAPYGSPKLTYSMPMNARFERISLGKVNSLIEILRRIWSDFANVIGIKK
jgi:hypothetical protein